VKSMLRLRQVINERSQLNDVCVSCTPPEDDDLTFATTEHWKVVLHPDQTVPGALLLTSIRHVPKISRLTAAESAEWFLLFSVIEATLEQLHGAAMINASCERNWAYRSQDPDPPLLDGRPNPHVHWHIAPRYDKEVHIGDETFNDIDFGKPLRWRARRPAPSTRNALIDGLFSLLSTQPGVASVS